MKSLQLSWIWLMCIWQVMPVMGRPSISFFCELEGESLQSLCSDPSIMADLKYMKAAVRVGVSDFSDARADGVRRLNESGIPVIAWLLLPPEDGRWFNARNYDKALARYQGFRRWSEAHQLRWEGVGLDLEPDIEDIRRWYMQPAQVVWQGYLRLFDQQVVSTARTHYQELIEIIQNDGYSVESYIFPPMVDERQAGTEAFQRAVGTIDVPTAKEIPMCYTSISEVSPAMILSYGDGRPAIALGSTGGGLPLIDGEELPPLVWPELKRDLLLAQQVCQEIHLFSLEGCIRHGMLDSLKYFNWQQPVSLYSRELTDVKTYRKRLGRGLRILDMPILLTFVGIIILGLIGWGMIVLLQRLTRPKTLNVPPDS